MPNALWTPADPAAYGGVPVDEAPTLVLTALRRDGRGPPQRRPLGRPRRHPDQGGLRPGPDPGEQPLAAPVGPRLLRDRDDVDGDEPQRHRPLGHVPVPRVAPPGRRADRGGHPDDEDGRAARSASGRRCPSRSGAWRWATAPAPAAATSGATARSRGSTGSCRWTSTCPAARRGPEGLIYGMMKLQQLVKERRGHWPERSIGPTVPEGI